ncbi:putative trehalase [Bienertia sinuspersici]
MPHTMIEALTKSGSKEAYSMAEDIATRWIRTNYTSYMRIGEKHEKYDVEKHGEFGGGGKFVSQVYYQKNKETLQYSTDKKIIIPF